MVGLHRAPSLALATYAIVRSVSKLVGHPSDGFSAACYNEREPIAESNQNAALDPRAYWTLHT